MKRGMPSGAQTPDGIIFLLALIFSKAPPRYPPHHGAHWAYTMYQGKKSTLKMAENSCGKPEIFNSDQGNQFTRSEFAAELRARGIQISMDGRGRCLDNIKMERFC